MTKEHELIKQLFAPLCVRSPDEVLLGASGAESETVVKTYGLQDDAALLVPAANQGQILTTDMIVAGKHFFADDSPEDIAHKALAVNISDMVAKGGYPHSYLLSIAIPDTSSISWLERFAAGLAQTQATYGCRLVGGDTVTTPGPLTINITIIGQGGGDDGLQMVRRKGAGEGDIVFVTGHIGGAALGLLARTKDQQVKRLLSTNQRNTLLRYYLRPVPNLTLVPFINRYASAAIDISDGLLGDFSKLCAESGLGGQIFQKAVPLDETVAMVLDKRPELLETALTVSDDYQVLLCVRADKADQFADDVKNLTASKVWDIGLIVPLSEGVNILDDHGNPLKLSNTAYDHLTNIKAHKY